MSCCPLTHVWSQIVTERLQHSQRQEMLGHTGDAHHPGPQIVNREADVPRLNYPALTRGQSWYGDAQLLRYVIKFAPQEVSIMDLQKRKLRHAACVGLSPGCHRKARSCHLSVTGSLRICLQLQETRSLWKTSLSWNSEQFYQLGTISDAPNLIHRQSEALQGAEPQSSLLNVFSTKLKSYFILN